MTSKLHSAFDGIRAEAELKSATIAYLQAHINNKRKPRAAMPVGRIAAVFASALISVFMLSSYSRYYAYVDLDANPSIELAINRYDRVIGTHAFNADGESLLAGINVMHKDYRDAVDISIDAMRQQGFITDDALISVTLQLNDETKNTEMLTVIETTVRSHHGMSQVDAFAVDSDTRAAALNLNLSPAKYLAIMQLQEVDPTATVENCRNHSIGEIYKLTQAHHSGHNNNHSTTEPTIPPNSADDDHPANATHDNHSITEPTIPPNSAYDDHPANAAHDNHSITEPTIPPNSADDDHPANATHDNEHGHGITKPDVTTRDKTHGHGTD